MPEQESTDHEPYEAATEEEHGRQRHEAEQRPRPWTPGPAFLVSIVWLVTLEITGG